MTMLPTLAYFHGEPESLGQLRTEMADFKVFEQLPFLPCGEGEHLLIHLRKTGLNTIFVARALAKYFAVKEMLVSYAGLKDRFAVTEQWFGIHVPGKTDYDLSDLVIEGVEVLSYQRHNKKLRIGTLSGNRFELTLRNVTNIEALEKRWQQIINHGVPNYFGEQRFGIDGNNIDKAKALFQGQKVKDKKKRGIYLSAARSYLFNQVVSKRIEHQYFERLNTGDVCMLSGTQSIFVVENVDDTLKQRFIERDIDLTAPMWGAGELKTQGETLVFEQQVIDDYPEFTEGLPRFGLKQERRRIRLSLSDAEMAVEEINKERCEENQQYTHTVILNFSLPAGSYATTILRELLQYNDMTERADSQGNIN